MLYKDSLWQTSFPSSGSSELGRLFRLSHRAFTHSWNDFSGFLVVNPAFSAMFISFCSCAITVAASSVHFLSAAVSLSPQSLIHFSFPLLLNNCISHVVAVTSFLLDCKLCSSPVAQILPDSKLVLPTFPWWRGCVDRVVELLYVLAESGKRFFFGALTIVFCFDFVVGQDIWLWTTWSHAVSFMSRLVCLINLNEAKSVFWLCVHWEWKS